VIEEPGVELRTLDEALALYASGGD